MLVTGYSVKVNNDVMGNNDTNQNVNNVTYVYFYCAIIYILYRHDEYGLNKIINYINNMFKIWINTGKFAKRRDN